ISIPSSVKFINGSAFLYCSNLKKVVIPASVEKIGLGANVNKKVDQVMKKK
ncbi:MAG: leucine-rich repeat protein, partial [Candidatus Syntrophosphaera sp.]|nr:leucine-rich repeat protein [Candidatus Syntrophosphaera sp.]